MDVWQNSTPVFGVTAFCMTKIVNFRKDCLRNEIDSKNEDKLNNEDGPNNKDEPKMNRNPKIKMTLIEKTNKNIKLTSLFVPVSF